MSRQDKATTEKFTRTLRELVKRPENKVCADCKRNDPRWASWNIGVFLCIRCSGIHRGMGTHISKVKSVDLDTWTPEQMESIQKWGNHLANLYWEAHLKPGHIPPEHKIESFVRSKYESKRWALEGPPPSNPSDLENTAQLRAPAPPPSQVPAASRPSHSSASTRAPAATTTSQPQAHRLLSSNYASTPTNGVPTGAPATRSSQRGAPASSTSSPAPAQPKAPENDLFSLDFHAPSTPAPAAPEAPKKDVKQDILSLFASPPPASAPAVSTFGQFGTAPAASPWAAHATAPQPQQPQAISMLGTSGVGAWGANSGWGVAVAAPPVQGNLWGAATTPPGSHQQQPGLFNTTAVWGTSTAAPVQDQFGLLGSARVGSVQPKKDEVFGDLWGGFK